MQSAFGYMLSAFRKFLKNLFTASKLKANRRKPKAINIARYV